MTSPCLLKETPCGEDLHEAPENQGDSPSAPTDTGSPADPQQSIPKPPQHLDELRDLQQVGLPVVLSWFYH